MTAVGIFPRAPILVTVSSAILSVKLVTTTISGFKLARNDSRMNSAQ